MGFIYWNEGSIVLGICDTKLGDKSNHIAKLHVPQLFYFFSFTSFFGGTILIPELLKLKKYQVVPIMVSSVLFIPIINYFT